MYSGSSASKYRRIAFSNTPLNIEWVLDALDQVPKLQDYPLKAINFDDDMIDANAWTKKYEKPKKDVTPPPTPQRNGPSFVETGQSRRCFSCGELKPVQSYNKNEKKRGVEARCITCVATKPKELDLSVVCPNCKSPMLNDGGTICQPCMNRAMMASSPMKQPPAAKKEM